MLDHASRQEAGEFEVDADLEEGTWVVCIFTGDGESGDVFDTQF